MEKLNYQSKPRPMDPELKEHFFKVAIKNIKSEGMPRVFRINFWLNIFIQIVLVVGIYMASDYFFNANFTMILIVVIAALLLIYWISYTHINKKIRRDLFADLHGVQQEIFVKHFEKHFDNVTAKGRVPNNIAISMVESNRPTSIPGDARVTRVRTSYAFEVEGATVIMNHFTWHWTRTKGSGKNRRTVHYHVPSIVMGVKDLESNKFSGLNLKILKNTLFRRNKDKLENMEFDKKWVHYTNDEVKLRMLLSPLSQERLSEDPFFIDKHGKFVFSMQNNEVAICKEEARVPFDFEYTTKNSKINYRTKGIDFKRQVAEILFEHFNRDLMMAQVYMSKLFAFKNLLR